MATPPEPTQNEVDAAQDALIKQTQHDQMVIADYLRQQSIFIPETVAQGTPAQKKQPPCNSDAPVFGAHGYRLFPFNGGWHSFRQPVHAKFREILKGHYGFDDNEFFLRFDSETKEVKVVAWGEAQDEVE